MSDCLPHTCTALLTPTQPFDDCTAKHLHADLSSFSITDSSLVVADADTGARRYETVKVMLYHNNDADLFPCLAQGDAVIILKAKVCTMCTCCSQPVQH